MSNPNQTPNLNLKKLLAIALLTLHLYNIGGYLALHQLMVYRSDKFFDEQIGKNLYNIDDLTEVKIQVEMPAVTNWHKYQKVSGQVQFQNASYNFVKMRMTRHAIYLMCVPNYATTHLFTQNIINAKQINDIPVPKKEHVPLAKINLVMYSHQLANFEFSMPAVGVSEMIFTKNIIIFDAFIAGPGKPPNTTFLS